MHRKLMENFIVSARKYRPATFISVVGQNHITSTLRNAISRGQLAHAYLFCGPRGVGKTTCARIFAKAINCMNPGPDSEACGACESCRSFDEGRSFNIHELDAASNNSVDDIRSLTDQVRIPPQIGRYSVYIIDEVHMLSAQAFNAFLKTLEEPPAHAVFILATTEKHKIIPTILSRCQIFDFNRIKVEDSVGYMKHIAGEEGVTFDEESLNLIARKADGGMRDALSMFDKAVSFCGSDLRYKEVAQSLNILDYDTYFDAADTILAGDYGEALLMFDRVLAQGFSGQTFMSGMGSHLRDLLVAKNPQTAPLLDVTRPLLERYQAQAKRCGTELLFEGMALLTDLDAKIRIATNQRLLVELALMKLCNLASPDEKKAGTPAADENDPLKKKSEQVGPQLPQFNKEKKVSAAPTVEAATPAVPPAPKQEATPAPQPQTAQEATPAPPTPEPAKATPAPEPAAEKAPETAHIAKTAPTPAASAETATTPAPVSPVKSPLGGISGRSLADIMSGPAKDGQKAEVKEEAAAADPEAQEKIERMREKFLGKLAQERPRIGVVFETMEVEGNTVRVKVASQTLHDEVQRHRTETLQLLATVAGVYGPLELEVAIDETMKAAKPIRIEDKVKYMSDHNPAFNDLRRTLEMEIE